MRKKIKDFGEVDGLLKEHRFFDQHGHELIFCHPDEDPRPGYVPFGGEFGDEIWIAAKHRVCTGPVFVERI